MTTTAHHLNSGRPGLDMPLREAKIRFSQLVSLAEHARQTTVISRDGRAIAAIVPAAELRAADPPNADGWERRITRLREHLAGQHRAEVRDLVAALRGAWAELDRLSPPGSDRAVDRLRTAHRHLVTDR